MKIESKEPQVFTLARAVLVRLLRNGGRIGPFHVQEDSFNVHLSHVVGQCEDADKDMARIVVTEVAWDKDNPCFHVLGDGREFKGPITVTVRMSNILSVHDVGEQEGQK